MADPLCIEKCLILKTINRRVFLETKTTSVKCFAESWQAPTSVVELDSVGKWKFEYILPIFCGNVPI